MVEWFGASVENQEISSSKPGPRLVWRWGPHRTLPTEHGIDTEIGAVYTVFGDKGNGLSSKFLDPWALCAHLDPMPRR